MPSNDALWESIDDVLRGDTDRARVWNSRAEAILTACNPVQRALILDEADYKAGRCPRRSGKSFSASAYALYLGEKFPGSRVLIIGLTLKAAKENYWSLAPGGIQALSQRFDLRVETHEQTTSWQHENGSVGYLAGAETSGDLERLRGAKVECDLIVIDECKSFSPEHLEYLINEVLVPGLTTRNGKLLLVGTPGSIPGGPFWEATAESNRRKVSDNPERFIPTCLNFRTRTDDSYGLTPDEIASTWSLHTWTLRDNVAAEEMSRRHGRQTPWERAEQDRIRRGWSVDHPAWRREILGEWVSNNFELVYHKYAEHLEDGSVNWTPDPNSGEPWGLPAEGGPWNYIIGLDFGYEDPTAVVVLAYGEHDKNLYHVDEFKAGHLTFDDVDRLLQTFNTRYPATVIVYDAQGKQLGQSLADRGHPVFPSEKREKFDYIELLNSDFSEGRLKILRGSELHRELTGLQYDLSKGTKHELARLGKLRESPACPNHLCDALLYVWRWSQHGSAKPKATKYPEGSREWWAEHYRREKENYIANQSQEPAYSGFGKVDHFATRNLAIGRVTGKTA